MLLALAAPANAASRGVKSADLIKAAKAARLSDIDYTREQCKDHRSVEEWLHSALGNAARSIKWTGGACKLANRQNPRDAGTKWCAQAAIMPKKGGPPAMIEIYFEAPKGGRPGKAFAFRALVHTKAGPDSMRETAAFEANWGETHIPRYKAPEDGGC
jgi:hypothetical protein